jgi:hypothetical protein
MTSSVTVRHEFDHLTAEERRHHTKVMTIDFTVYAALVLLSAYFIDKEPASVVPVDKSLSALFWSVVNMALVTYTWILLLTFGRDTKIDTNYPTKELGGHFVFLTHMCFCAMTMYTTFVGVSHVLAYCGIEAPVFSKVQHFTYKVATFVGSANWMVTLLFLKVCWFEPKWQSMAVQNDKRTPGMRFLQFWTHLVPAVSTVVDLYFLKQAPEISSHGAGFYSIIKTSIAFSIFFLSYMEVCYKFNGGFYPYPFVYDINTLAKKAIFLAAVSMLLCIVAGTLIGIVHLKEMYYLAV